LLKTVVAIITNLLQQTGNGTQIHSTGIMSLKIMPKCTSLKLSMQPHNIKRA